MFISFDTFSHTFYINSTSASTFHCSLSSYFLIHTRQYFTFTICSISNVSVLMNRCMILSIFHSFTSPFLKIETKFLIISCMMKIFHFTIQFVLFHKTFYKYKHKRRRMRKNKKTTNFV